jgi:hypothetical protein
MKSLNLWDLALEQKKEKAKPKVLAKRETGNPLDFRPALIIAEPLAFILTRPEICIQNTSSICIKMMDM